ncbi:drug/metabolite transporter (DMT)-like permease [Murinocardiopsis flavida]|uniref:Drug/metabolite transporter (DMT)-like permease n=1 Tax=Murinocardiopsis flavida TaxID=645275 RepID=A0A2P8DRN7_9ACTN|nr:DMT family transporter [Murinocardiopsis flavida]PSK99878.1 drug/metabolite transporter (DMT)-like permease [Murinocardiopsis flavida]
MPSSTYANTAEVDATPATEARPAKGSRPATGTVGAGALAVGFVLMWSSGFIGGRLGTETAGTLSLMAWRFLLLVPLLAVVLGLVHLVGWRPVRLSGALLRRHVLLGLLSQVCYLGGTVGAIEYGVGTGTAAIIAALQPLLAGSAAGPILGKRVSGRQWAGLAFGFVGVAVVVGGDLTAGDAPAWAYALPFAGMLALVSATLVEARRPMRASIVESLGIQCATSAVAFSVMAYAAGDLYGPHLTDSAFWTSVVWFVLLSTLGGYGLYWLALRRLGAMEVSSLIYLTPPATAVWAWAMFGDPIPATGVLGFAICAFGVGVVFLRASARPVGRI